MSLVFWWKLHWVCKLIWLGWTFWQRYCSLPISEQELSFCFMWFYDLYVFGRTSLVMLWIPSALFVWRHLLFLSSISKVNIAGYDILGWSITVSFWTLNGPYPSLLAYKVFAKKKKVCCLLVFWGQAREFLNMIWQFSLCLEFCLGTFIVCN